MSAGVPRTRRNTADALRISIAIDGEEAQLLRQFMADEDVQHVNTAVKMILSSVLRGDRRWWAVVRSQRRSAMYLFRASLHEEFVKKMKELTQSVEDELALFNEKDPSYGHPDST